MVAHAGQLKVTTPAVAKLIARDGGETDTIMLAVAVESPSETVKMTVQVPLLA